MVKMWCEQHVKCAWNVLGTVIYLPKSVREKWCECLCEYKKTKKKKPKNLKRGLRPTHPPPDEGGLSSLNLHVVSPTKSDEKLRL